MPNTADIKEEINQYLSRLSDLYASVTAWVRAAEPGAQFTRPRVELAEELTGQYSVESLEIARPGKIAVRLIPRGIFMVGAHGRVDARSRLGREILVWIERGGAHIHIQADEGGKMLEHVMHPLYSEVEEGWAWENEQALSLLHLTEEVFRDNVLARLSE